VAAARGTSRLETLDVLGRLERRHGLVRSGPVLARFDHRLLRDVVYGDLAPALRAELHARVADAIEARPEGGDPGARAWRVLPHRLRGPDPARAAGIAVEAVSWGDRVQRRAEAYALARRALEAGGADAETRRRLVFLVTSLAVATGRSAETEGLLAEEVARAEAAGDAGLLARLRYRVAITGIQRGRFEEALAAASAAVETFRAEGPRPHATQALRIKGQALWCLGRLEESCETQREALREATEHDTPRSRATVAVDLSSALQETGRLAEAEALLLEARETLREAGDRTNVATADCTLGNVLFDAGRRTEALARFEAALETDRALALVSSEAVAWVNVAKVRLSFGDLERARAAYRLCEDLAREAEVPRVEAYAVHGLATAALWRGDREEARRLYEAALATRRAIGHRPGVAETALALGALAAEEGRTDEARALLAEAAETAAAVSDPSAASLARLRLALLGAVPPAAARDAFEAAGPRLRHDARLEGNVLLWRLTGDPAALREAKRLADLQRRDAPPAARAAMLERVPLLRALSATPDPR
jgi:tetratricopeptide (TPR) repeat protein